MSATFAVATWLTPPDWLGSWRRPVWAVALVVFLLACSGWLFAHAPGLTPFARHRRASHPMSLAFIFVLGGLLAVGVWLLVVRGDAQSVPLSPSAGTQVLLLPAANTIVGLEWVPKRSYAVQVKAMDTTGAVLEDSRPLMRLKNIGPLPVTDIEISWLVPGAPISEVFLHSNVLRPYRPRVEDEYLYFLTDPDAPREIGIPVSDEAISLVPFAPATPTSDDATTFPLPGEILNNIVLRLLCEMPRPRTWQFFLSGPDVQASVRYRIGAAEQRAEFTVRPKVMYFADTAGGLGAPTLIPPEFAEANFRGNITFEVTSR